MSSGKATDAARIAATLQQLRHAFLTGLPERCDQIEQLLLGFSAPGGAATAYEDLYRRVHSLKGSAGTHGVPFLSAICHQLEDLLTQVGERGVKENTDLCLQYIDLLRRGTELARAGSDSESLEAALAALRAARLRNRQPVLLVNASGVQIGLCQAALASLPVQLTVLSDGIEALEQLLLERFALVITARSIKRLNGIALVCALRASESANRDIPAILLSADAVDTDALPVHVDHIVRCDGGLGTALHAAVE